MKGRKKTTVLIVDDDNSIREYIAEVLGMDGYNVIEAADGKTAIKMVASGQPDLILLDLMLEDIDGFEVCRRLRRDFDGMILPIVILSANHDQDSIVKASECGANDYIVKPIEAIGLKSRVMYNLRRKDMYEESEAERKDLITLLEVAKSITSTLSSGEILSIIVRKVAEVIDVARCSIVRIGRKAGTGYVVTTYENPKLKNYPLELMKYPEIRMAIEKKGTVIVEDIQQDPVMTPVKDLLKKLKFTSILIIPILVREEVVGTLFLRTSRKEKNFTAREIKMCEVIANMSASALTNAHLFESMELANLELEKLALTDGLTGAMNHRQFKYKLEEEFTRATRYDTSLSCIMLDLDYFKNINDAFGHAQGDAVLKEIANLLQGVVRKTDIVARYGGEEFSILLPQTGEEGAFMQAERIREAVKGYRCSGETCIMVTASLGVATYPGHSINSGDHLVGCADKALYEAKNSGRNRTIAFMG